MDGKEEELLREAAASLNKCVGREALMKRASKLAMAHGWVVKKKHARMHLETHAQASRLLKQLSAQPPAAKLAASAPRQVHQPQASAPLASLLAPAPSAPSTSNANATTPSLLGAQNPGELIEKKKEKEKKKTQKKHKRADAANVSEEPHAQTHLRDKHEKAVPAAQRNIPSERTAKRSAAAASAPRAASGGAGLADGGMADAARTLLTLQDTSGADTAPVQTDLDGSHSAALKKKKPKRDKRKLREQEDATHAAQPPSEPALEQGQKRRKQRRGAEQASCADAPLSQSAEAARTPAAPETAHALGVPHAGIGSDSSQPDAFEAAKQPCSLGAEGLGEKAAKKRKRREGLQDKKLQKHAASSRAAPAEEPMDKNVGPAAAEVQPADAAARQAGVGADAAPAESEAEVAAADTAPRLTSDGLTTWRDDVARTAAKAGPFTTAEDATLMAALREFAGTHGLSTEHWEWVGKMSEVKKSVAASRKEGFLKQVAASLPQRKFTSVWSRLFRLTHPGNNKGAWTAAEDSQLTELFAVHGSKWKPIGDAIGRLPESCRDRWRILGVHGKVTGRWSEAEEAKLTEAVAEYGRATGLGLFTDVAEVAAAEAAVPVSKGKRVAVRDGVDWEVISKAVATRDSKQCMSKWYTQLRPNMTDTSEWSRGDDVKLLKALWAAKADYEYSVRWGELVAKRGGSVVQRRWHLMKQTISGSRNMELHQQVLYLVSVWVPDLLAGSAHAQRGSAGVRAQLYSVDQADADAAKALKASGDKDGSHQLARKIAGADAE